MARPLPLDPVRQPLAPQSLPVHRTLVLVDPPLEPVGAAPFDVMDLREIGGAIGPLASPQVDPRSLVHAVSAKQLTIWGPLSRHTMDEAVNVGLRADQMATHQVVAHAVQAPGLEAVLDLDL